MGRTVLITGANSGVGLATAIDLASRGFGVVGTARSNEKAESLFKAASDAGVEVDVESLDVTDVRRREGLVLSLEPWAVVNNAGYMNVGLVVDVPPEEALQRLHALVVAPMHLAALAIPLSPCASRTLDEARKSRACRYACFGPAPTS